MSILFDGAYNMTRHLLAPSICSHVIRRSRSRSPCSQVASPDASPHYGAYPVVATAQSAAACDGSLTPPYVPVLFSRKDAETIHFAALC